jgi:predicted RNase H-like HicB family nuclease
MLKDGTITDIKDCQVIVRCEGSEWVARCVQIPAAMSYGTDIAQCVVEAVAAIEDHLEYRRSLEG